MANLSAIEIPPRTTLHQ